MHPDLPDEQKHLDRAHDSLTLMRAKATELIDALAIGARSDHHDAAARHNLRRYRSALDVGAGPLCFGRIDESAGDRWYIGRRHVEDEHGDPLVVDWRARVATPFYRATFRDPQGLSRRRRFITDGNNLTDLYDEDFADADTAHHGGGIPDPLLAELDRARTGEIRDIVSTIQAEQDVIIRAPLDRLLIVQGGPGTGKTAVGLHRAALLLYDHREVLDREGVLVVGPNRLFLRYIAQVLPSLGETAVVQTTVAGLGALDVRGEDSDEAAFIKGDARMATVLERAAWERTAVPTDDIDVRTTYGRVVVPTEIVAEVLADCLAERATGRTVQGARDRFRADLLRVAHQRLLDRRPEGMKVSPEIADALRADAGLRRAVDRIWPATTAVNLVQRLITNRSALAAAADGVLRAEEQRTILRRRAARRDDEPWTAADLVLIDEADAVLGGRPRRYGHLVVDEAQDLSAMALRMLARRCARFPSMTVLGDLAQSTTPAGQQDWDDVVSHLGATGHPAVEYDELGIGYRVPGQILDWANLLLPSAGVAVTPARSARRTDAEPEVVAVAVEERAAAVVALALEMQSRAATVAVIAPEELHAEIVAAGLVVDDLLSLLDPVFSKGLEFDAVVVVEPAMVATAGAHGVRLLYVAMTRPVQFLAIVHAEPLPAALAAA